MCQVGEAVEGDDGLLYAEAGGVAVEDEVVVFVDGEALRVPVVLCLPGEREGAERGEDGHESAVAVGVCVMMRSS